MSLKTEQLYEFGSFRIEPDEHRLTREGSPLPLAPKAFDLLLYLVQNGGRLLTKEEILHAVWPDSFVEEANLTVTVSVVRKVLGEREGQLRYIETVPTKGYRFIASVKEGRAERILAVAGEAPGGLSALPPPDVSDPDAPATAAAGEREAGIRAHDSPAVSAAPLVPSKAIRSWLPASILLVVLSLLVGVYLIRREVKPLMPPAASQRTLAILPLRNLKQSAADDYLSFSLADAVITELAPVGSLTVRPSSAVEKYKEQTIDVRKVAADLQVDTLLTGTFIHEGDDLRITYQLVDVKTEKILGRDLIDLKYDKLMAVQDIVAQRVIQGLALGLPQVEAAQRPAAPKDPLAYEYFLRGVDRMGSHDFPIAVQMLEKSTQIDPNYAPAWAYLGQSYNSTASFQFGGKEHYEKAKNAFGRALALQPKQVEARIFLANFLIDTGEVEKAVPQLRDAQKDNPSNASLYWELGYAYRFAGMLKQSLEECQHARQIDPKVKGNGAVLNTLLYLGRYDDFLANLPARDDSFPIFYRGFAEYHLKRWDQAARDFDRAWQLEHTMYTQTGEALRDGIDHHEEEGLRLLHDLEEKIQEHNVGDPEGTYKIAETYAVLGDRDSALRMLRYSIEHGFFPWPYFRTDPLMSNIRSDPRFGELMETARRRYEAFERQFF